MNDIDKCLAKLRRKAVKEQHFEKTLAFEIADYFRTALKKFGYTISPDNWEKTKKAAEEVVVLHDNISIQEWKDCIDWVFSGSRYRDSFWKNVPVYSFGTVVKMFNTFKTYLYGKGAAAPIQEKRVKYGRLRSGK